MYWHGPCCSVGLGSTRQGPECREFLGVRGFYTWILVITVTLPLSSTQMLILSLSILITRSDWIFKIAQTTELTERVPHSFSVNSNFLWLNTVSTTHSDWLWSFALTDCLLRLDLTYTHAQSTRSICLDLRHRAIQ